MTLHKLSAGSGYEYLTRQVAAHDTTAKGRVPLADYYAAKGESPGVWLGSGLSGIDGIDVGDIVTAEQMLNLFGHGLDPLRGEPLGRPFRIYENQVADEFAAAVKSRLERLKESPGGADVLVGQLRAQATSDIAREFFTRQHGRQPANVRELDAAVKRYSRPPRAAVAGFDLTFSPVKSVSTLWALAPRDVSAVIERAHQSAVSDALRFIEREALFTREGLDGARQVETRGLIATAFTHRDSRAGDPDLHTHVAVANKVQTPDRKWLAIYGRVLYESAVAASETYNTALEQHLSEELGIRFAERPSADLSKRPVREIVGVDASLNHAWSSRRVDIELRQSELARDFRARHGRPSTPKEAIALAQQANLDTRDAKHEPRSLAEQRAAWREEATQALGSAAAVDHMIDSTLRRPATPVAQIAPQELEATAEKILSELEQHCATWRVTHVRAEAQRQLRGLNVPSDQLDAVVGGVVNDVLSRLSINLTPELDPIVEPSQLQRTDGTSVYRHAGRERFTSARVLAAEQQITDSAGRRHGRTVSSQDVDLALVEYAANGLALNPGQTHLVREMATSGQRVQVGIAAAGAGKTTAMRVLAQTWRGTGGDVIGLAPSAAAASSLSTEAGIAAETLAKLVADLDAHRSASFVHAMGPQTLVVIDESGMADTLTLARVIGHALERGASVRLIGDDQQLSAIGAGGVLRDVATTHGAVRLDELMRFSDPAEAAASLALREGDPSALGYYLDQDRVHIGNPETTTDDVFDQWSADRRSELDSLMLAPTREMVSDLNRRARAERVGPTRPDIEVRLADDNLASVGDTILTRRNDRRLSTSDTDWVKNGDRWTITGVHGGGIAARHNRSGLNVVLPASYVNAHVELGYASTVHSAQGLTADTMHGIANGTESRQMLYTMMSRGRHANHVHLAIASDSDPHQMMHPERVAPPTATEMLEAILGRDEAAMSATTTAREAFRPDVQLQDAAARYADAVHAAAEDLIGTARVEEIAQAAEALIPGLTQTNGWPSLAAQVLLIEANGGDASETLTLAATYRSLDGADDPANVLGWRVHGFHPTEGGPLPWLPAVPNVVSSSPEWKDYVAERGDRVLELTALVREKATENVPPWSPQDTSVAPGLAGDIAVWRAVRAVDADDTRPTGPPTPDFVLLEHQRSLDVRVARDLDVQAGTWVRPIVDIVGHRDGRTVHLAEGLARLAGDGVDAQDLLRQASRGGDLPDDHATAALESRVTRLLARTTAANRSGRHDQLDDRSIAPPHPRGIDIDR